MVYSQHFTLHWNYHFNNDLFVFCNCTQVINLATLHVLNAYKMQLVLQTLPQI